MNKCCVKCFNCKELKKYIKKMSMEKGVCDYCKNKDQCLIRAKDLSQFILEGIERAYEDVTCNGVDSHPELFGEGKSLEEILNDENLISENCEKSNDLIQELIEGLVPNWHDFTEGASDQSQAFYISLDYKIDFYGKKECGLFAAWDLFKELIKYKHRFLNTNSQVSDCLSNISIIFKDLTIFESVNTDIWRARKAEGRFSIKRKSVEDMLGSPPLSKTNNGRMSPVGISYFYGSSDIDTCLAEIKPDVDSDVWIGCFRPRKKLKILDLTKVKNIEIPSIFNSNYNHDLKFAKEFLIEFIAEISQPVHVNNTSIEYIPTQAFAEFVRNSGFHGIKYNSSQNKSGVNYILFFGCTSFDMCYKEHLWLKQVRVLRVSNMIYKLQEKQIADFKKNILRKYKCEFE